MARGTGESRYRWRSPRLTRTQNRDASSGYRIAQPQFEQRAICVASPRPPRAPGRAQARHAPAAGRRRRAAARFSATSNFLTSRRAGSRSVSDSSVHAECRRCRQATTSDAHLIRSDQAANRRSERLATFTVGLPMMRRRAAATPSSTARFSFIRLTRLFPRLGRSMFRHGGISH